MTDNTKNIIYPKTVNIDVGLSINDLNKYLPAIQMVDDIYVKKKIKQGIFYGLGYDGLKKIPNNSIDLIITEPPSVPLIKLNKKANRLTIGNYLDWNKDWLDESYRILKESGSIYVICDWMFSSMYQSLLNQKFKIQTRITWKNKIKKKLKNAHWNDNLSDIWFASKSDDFFFNQQDNKRITNFWDDIISIHFDKNEKQPKELIKRIIKTSSCKLNWILDPFCRLGGIGVNAIEEGRRFIGIEANKDKVLISMKRVDRK